MEFIESLKQRHSEYRLNKEISLSDAELQSFLEDITRSTPSAFNSQSQRVVMLLGEAHDKVWDYLIEVMRGIVEGEQFEKTKDKILGFKSAYGTILFFDDTEVTENLQKKFPLYKENFAKWSIEQNGMLQSNIWVGLSSKNIGASLQHYNELIESFVKETFDIPNTWELRAQMPFGHVVEKASAKPQLEINKRFLIRK
jgi:predicted oxidoreductase (fatty acid repression mutant protein)